VQDRRQCASSVLDLVRNGQLGAPGLLPPVQSRQQGRAFDSADHGARVDSGGIASFQVELTAGSEWSIGSVLVKCKTLRMEGIHGFLGDQAWGKGAAGASGTGACGPGQRFLFVSITGTRLGAASEMLCPALCSCAMVASGSVQNP
jgi:hypothetical protein